VGGFFFFSGGGGLVFFFLSCGIEVLKGHGCGGGYIGCRLLPSPRDVERFLAEPELAVVWRQNRDAQSRCEIETPWINQAALALPHYNGLPISSSFIVE